MIEKERDNKDFEFLMYQGTEENNYYRWRVYSFVQGDSEENWRVEPFQFLLGGNIWHPPKFENNFLISSEHDEKLKIKKKEEKSFIKDEKNTSNSEDSDEDHFDDNSEKKSSHIGLVELTSSKKQEIQNLLNNLNSKRLPYFKYY